MCLRAFAFPIAFWRWPIVVHWFTRVGVVLPASVNSRVVLVEPYSTNEVLANQTRVRLWGNEALVCRHVGVLSCVHRADSLLGPRTHYANCRPPFSMSLVYRFSFSTPTTLHHRFGPHTIVLTRVVWFTLPPPAPLPPNAIPTHPIRWKNLFLLQT